MATPDALQLVQNPQASESLIQALASSMGGTQALPSVQRSQYLAQALQSMQQHAGDNIRTPGALASNLMAEALLQYGQRRQNAKLLQQIGAGQAQQASEAQSGIYAPTQDSGAIPPPPPPGADASGSGAPSVAAALAARQANQSPYGPPATAPAPDASGPDALKTALTNKALTASGFFNDFFVPHEGKLNPHDANGSPSYYGLNVAANPDLKGAPPTQDQAQQIFEQRYFNPSGAPSLSPGLGAMAADTYAMNPSWEKRAMAASGGDPSKFMAERQRLEAADVARNPAVRPYANAWAKRDQDLLAYAQGLGFGQQPGAPGGAQVPQSAGTPPAAPGGPQGSQMMPAAYQVPQGAPGGAGGAPQPQPQAQAPQQSAPPQGPPTGQYATPQEEAYIHHMMTAYPQGSAPWQLGLAKAQEIQQRRMTPLDTPKDMMWDNQRGAYVPKPGTQYSTVASGPGGVTQADPFGQYHATSNPNMSAPPPGMQLVNGPNGPQLVQVPAAQQQRFRIPGSPGWYVNDARGQPQKVADDEYGPQQLFDLRNSVLKSDQASQYNAAQAAWEAMKGAAGQMNGPSAYAMRDTFARLINPGAVARVGTIQAIKEAQGIPEQVKSFFLNLQGDGDMSPQLRQQVMDAALPFLQAHYADVKALNDSNADFARRHGVDPNDVTIQLQAPERYVIGKPPQQGLGGGGGQQQQSVLPPGATHNGVPPGAPAGTVRNQRDGKFYINQGGRWFEWKPN